MTIAIIIPARYGSTRFPGKPLAMLAGKTILQRVVEAAQQAARNFENVSVHVTTDDARIADHARALGVACIMTPPECPSGSDRVWAAAQQINPRPTFIINLQGDAPMTPPSMISAIIDAYLEHPHWPVITPVRALSWAGLDALREAKKTTPFSGTCAVMAPDGRALWFSKTIIPAIRKEDTLRAESSHAPVYQHIGLYGFRAEALEQFCALPEAIYEHIEGLEQLRLLENNIPIHTVLFKTENDHALGGIDTPDDLTRAEALFT